MSQVDVVSVLYTLLQYVAVAFHGYRFTIVFFDSVKKLRPEELGNLWCDSIGYFLLYGVFTVFLFAFKFEKASLSRDDIVLPILNFIILVSVAWKTSCCEYDARKERSVRYLVKKYKFERAQVLCVLNTFEISHFPIDHFEVLLSLTKEQMAAKSIEDPEILGKAKTKLDWFTENVEALTKGKAFRRYLYCVDGSDSLKGKRYT